MGPHERPHNYPGISGIGSFITSWHRTELDNIAEQGLCAYVLTTVKEARSRGVVVGHDHRHHSERWAKLTAAAFIDQGVPVYFHSGVVHTPLYVHLARWLTPD